MFADVIVHTDAPLPQPLTYSVPDALAVLLGDAVLVPLSAQQLVGYVVGVQTDAPPHLTGKIRPLLSVIEDAAPFDGELLELARWVTSQTLSDLKDCLKLIAPDVMTSQVETVLSLSENWRDLLTGTRSVLQKAIADALDNSGPLSPARLSKLVPGDISSPLADLRRKGVVLLTRRLKRAEARQKTVRVLRLSVPPEVAREEAGRLLRAPRQAKLLRALAENEGGAFPIAGLTITADNADAGRALSDKGLACYAETAVRRDPFRMDGGRNTPPALSDAQAHAAHVIGQALAAKDGRTILLHGVTGSGKTEVYLDAAARARVLGRSVLIVLPEIGLTAQVLDLFKARLGEDDVAVLHSALSPGERFDEWRRIKSGAAGVVVGARSAVFAPVSELGLIILDEEHDGSFKQDSVPRYHARDVARERARQSGATVVLGSATPSLESFYRAAQGAYQLLSLPERISSRPLPPVTIVDLREEMKVNSPLPQPLPLQKGRGEQDNSAPPLPSEGEGAGGRGQKPEKPAPSVLGHALTEALADRLEKREQAILFLNRRGFAPFLLCRDCGFTFRCPNCDVSLTYHKGTALLQCHHCDFARRAPAECPKCGGPRLRPFGLGTEKVEAAVTEAFPDARVLRMDRDTMTRKGAHADTLRAFRRGMADILVGTQMVTKGLDFPNVTLVGVVSADTALNVPDFRAPERAFQLLTQVAGRAGRGTVPGEVIVQTFTPEHPSVVRASSHDYLGFYEGAIEERRELGYPPFSHMANLVFSDEDEGVTQGRAQTLADALAENAARPADGLVLGPAACALSRLRGRFRWHLAVRCASKENLLAWVGASVTSLSSSDRSGLSVDIDPLSML